MNRVFVIVFISLLSIRVSGGAADARRFHDVIFTQVTMDSVQYTTADGQALWMDVYQPAGDEAALRPLVILAHGGSFMHGSRRREICPALCRELAQRGYVAVSIDYRLTTMLHMASRPGAYRNIIRAVADGRASVRWFLDDMARGNKYRIDQRKIFFGGTSAGAILAEQLGYIDSAAECKPVLRRIVRKYMPDAGALPHGTIHAVISLAGALLDTTLIGPDEPALLHIHGDHDRVVPYGHKRAVFGLAPFEMAGLGASRPRYISQHLQYTEYVFAGAGHTPWDAHHNTLNKEGSIVLDQIIDFLQKEIN